MSPGVADPLPPPDWLSFPSGGTSGSSLEPFKSNPHTRQVPKLRDLQGTAVPRTVDPIRSRVPSLERLQGVSEVSDGRLNGGRLKAR